MSAATTEDQIVCVDDANNASNTMAQFIQPIEYELTGGSTGGIVTGLPPGVNFTTTPSNTILITGNPTIAATSMKLKNHTLACKIFVARW